MLRSVLRIPAIASSRFAPSISTTISSSIDEKEAFHLRALATGMKGYRQRDVHAIELTQTHYKVGDSTSPMINAEVIGQQDACPSDADESSNERKASAEVLSGDDREGLGCAMYLALVLGVYYDVRRSEFK
jgi:hypothetical protein